MFDAVHICYFIACLAVGVGAGTLAAVPGFLGRGVLLGVGSYFVITALFLMAAGR